MIMIYIYIHIKPNKLKYLAMFMVYFDINIQTSVFSGFSSLSCPYQRDSSTQTSGKSTIIIFDLTSTKLLAGVHKFYKHLLSKSHLKCLGTRRVTLNKFHIGDPHILGSTVQTLVARDLSTPEFGRMYIFRRNVIAFDFRK